MRFSHSAMGNNNKDWNGWIILTCQIAWPGLRVRCNKAFFWNHFSSRIGPSTSLRLQKEIVRRIWSAIPLNSWGQLPLLQDHGNGEHICTSTLFWRLKGLLSLEMAKLRYALFSAAPSLTSDRLSWWLQNAWRIQNKLISVDFTAETVQIRLLTGLEIKCYWSILIRWTYIWGEWFW